MGAIHERGNRKRVGNRAIARVAVVRGLDEDRPNARGGRLVDGPVGVSQDPRVVDVDPCAGPWYGSSLGSAAAAVGGPQAQLRAVAVASARMQIPVCVRLLMR